MALSQFIFKKGNFIGEIELDVIVNESAEADSDITSNPIENGADVNDHIIIKPMIFSITGIVSNTKVKPFPISQISTFTSDSTPAADAWEALLELQASRTPFTWVSNLKAYDNVVIKNIRESQDKDTSNSLYFTANLKEFIYVGSQVLTAEQFNEANVADQTTPTIEGGLK